MKHKVRRKSNTTDEIVKIDARTFEIKDYMIYHSDDDKWLCDCMSFVMNLQDNGQTFDCKHILRCKSLQ